MPDGAGRRPERTRNPVGAGATAGPVAAASVRARLAAASSPQWVRNAPVRGDSNGVLGAAGGTSGSGADDGQPEALAARANQRRRPGAVGGVSAWAQGRPCRGHVHAQGARRAALERLAEGDVLVSAPVRPLTRMSKRALAVCAISASISARRALYRRHTRAPGRSSQELAAVLVATAL